MGLPTDDRRSELRATAAHGYRWWRHVLPIALLVATGLAVSVSQLHDVRPVEWLGFAGMLLFTNFGEYAVHRWQLHVPAFPRRVYHRHVVEHHAFFTFERMAVDGWEDVRWVLFPPWALPLLIAAVLPICLALRAIASANVAWLYLLAVVVYYGVYEVLHTLAHLPPAGRWAGSRFVRAVTHHHRVHHDPALMRRWNFNFTLPIFDRLFGTTYRATGAHAYRPAVARRLVLALLLVPALAPAAPAPVAPAPPLTSVGRWLVDATGRVVMLHGVNEVTKTPPFHPAARGFGEDDVAFLAGEGFNALRLGVDMRGLMPAPGLVDGSYIDHIGTTVAEATAGGLFVLLDFHQDGYAPKYNGNGFPDWMAIDDGLPNPPDAVFPTYYLTNPAMQRAFEHLWDNSPIDGVGLQDYLVLAYQQVATRFRGEAMVLGTELINEPWPGAAWQPCIAPAGCGALEAELLVPFHRRSAAALRAIAPAQFVFVEPFVLFNFGLGPTTLPGTDPGVALSFHSYAIDQAGEVNVVRFGSEAAERDGKPVIVTEFGASRDPVLLNRLTAQFEDRLLPWMFWHYSEEIVRDMMRPLTPDVPNADALGALVRPYPVATTGVPTRIAFDSATGAFAFDYTPARAGGGTFAKNLDTVVFVPRRHYPNGYRVKATGARMISTCPTRLRLRTRRSARLVRVQITPAAPGAKPQRRCRR